ncbi:MAG: hypothetical protein ICV79_20200, partial [Flavisolibacter sp.]|nr:hypothetical protein [Flavisolibacter sp.]
MKVYSLLFLFVFHTSVAVAQTPRVQVDSLRGLLENTSEDTSRILLLTQLSIAYRFFNSDSAILLAEQAIRLAKEKK